MKDYGLSTSTKILAGFFTDFSYSLVMYGISRDRKDSVLHNPRRNKYGHQPQHFRNVFQS